MSRPRVAQAAGLSFMASSRWPKPLRRTATTRRYASANDAPTAPRAGSGGRSCRCRGRRAARRRRRRPVEELDRPAVRGRTTGRGRPSGRGTPRTRRWPAPGRCRRGAARAARPARPTHRADHGGQQERHRVAALAVVGHHDRADGGEAHLAQRHLAAEAVSGTSDSAIRAMPKILRCPERVGVAEDARQHQARRR